MSKNAFKVFILEDDEWYNKLLVHTVSLNPDFVVKSFFTASELYKALKEMPNVITVDYNLPDGNGAIVLETIKNTLPDAEVIIISDKIKLKQLWSY